LNPQGVAFAIVYRQPSTLKCHQLAQNFAQALEDLLDAGLAQDYLVDVQDRLVAV